MLGRFPRMIRALGRFPKMMRVPRMIHAIGRVPRMIRAIGRFPRMISARQHYRTNNDRAKHPPGTATGFPGCNRLHPWEPLQRWHHVQQLQEMTPSLKTQMLKWQFLDGFVASSLLYGFFAYSALQWIDDVRQAPEPQPHDATTTQLRWTTLTNWISLKQHGAFRKRWAWAQQWKTCTWRLTMKHNKNTKTTNKQQ